MELKFEKGQSKQDIFQRLKAVAIERGYSEIQTYEFVGCALTEMVFCWEGDQDVLLEDVTILYE